MGWTETHKPNGMKIDDFFANFWDGSKCRWLGKGYLVERREYYRPAITEDGEAFAVVMMVSFNPRDTYFNFAYKDMEESMGPNIHRAPAAMLDLLDSYGEPKHEWAKEWRAKCRKYAERKAAIKNGAIVKFKRVLEFTDGFASDTMVIVERESVGRRGRKSKRIRFANPDYPGVGRYRITNWQNMEFEIIGAVA